MTTNKNRTIPRLGRVRQAKQGGFSLVEVLVSIVVFAIGMLGIAGILLVSMRNAQGAMEQTAGVVQTYAMLDTLRANKAQAIIGNYNLPQYTCSLPSDDNRVGAELAYWIQSAQAQLGPSACGRIVCTSLTCEVSLRWNDERASGGSQERQYTVSTRL